MNSEGVGHLIWRDPARAHWRQPNKRKDSFSHEAAKLPKVPPERQIIFF